MTATSFNYAPTTADPMYAPQRDFAHCGVALISKVCQRADPAVWTDWDRELADKLNTRPADVRRAIDGLLRVAATPLSGTTATPSKMLDAFEAACGRVPIEAIAFVNYHVAMYVLNVWYYGIRDVTLQGALPDNMYAASYYLTMGWLRDPASQHSPRGLRRQVWKLCTDLRQWWASWQLLPVHEAVSRMDDHVYQKRVAFIQSHVQELNTLLNLIPNYDRRQRRKHWMRVFCTPWYVKLCRMLLPRR
jgi:hypothetical protein